MALLFATILAVYLIFVTLAIFSKSTTIAIISYSAISCATFFIYYIYNAADVALTEISIGMFLTFFFFYITHHKCGVLPVQNKKYFEIFCVATCCLAIFCTLIYIANLLELFSANHEYSEYYLEKTRKETHVDNIITAILASYRAFDTMGETLIIATSSLGISTILKNKKPALKK